jgi:hypothetical protein
MLSLAAAVFDRPSVISRKATLVCVNSPSPDAISPKPTVPLPLFTT